MCLIFLNTMFLSKGFLKLNLIFYFMIHHWMILPNARVSAILDIETTEFLNGKVIRAALLHVRLIIIVFKM